MKYALITGFILMVAAQWYAPLSLVFDAERTIDDGVEYRFKTEPVDPSDPFRGKYIILNFNEERYHPDDTTEATFPDNSIVYAIIEEDSEGFAKISKLTAEQPTGDVDYMSVSYLYGYNNDVSLKFPFSRFYMEESKASEAEQLYWRTRFDSTMVSYAKVMVRNGDTKLVDVMVNDSSIVDIVRRINAGKEKENTN